jgi:hypothetical protein
MKDPTFYCPKHGMRAERCPCWEKAMREDEEEKSFTEPFGEPEKGIGDEVSGV